MKTKFSEVRFRLATLAAICSFVAVMLVAQSCEKGEENETKISRNNETESHNNGQNCMSCHKSGGPGEGHFKLAGSVYDSLLVSPKPNGFIKLYTGPNGSGTLKYTVEVDGNGNFYTTEAIDFGGSGLYPSIVGASGQQRFMGSATITGACNNCHNNTEDKIWVN